MGSSPNDTEVNKPSSQAVGMQTPENSSGIVPSSDNYIAPPTYRDQHPFLGAVQDGLLAFGQGLTDQPFLTSKRATDLEKQKQAFEQWSSTKSPQAKAMAEIWKKLYAGDTTATNKTLFPNPSKEEAQKAIAAGATHFDNELGKWVKPVEF